MNDRPDWNGVESIIIIDPQEFVRRAAWIEPPAKFRHLLPVWDKERRETWGGPLQDQDGSTG